MPPKIPKTKKRYLRTSIEIKKELISKWESGKRLTELSKEYDMVKSTICTILKNRNAIKEANVARGVKILSANRTPAIEEMEKLLLLWMKEKQSAGEIISEALICDRARKFHTEIKHYTQSNEEFKASKGWFDKFKRRIGIHSVIRYEEANGSMPEEAREYTDLQNYINTMGFMPPTLYHADVSVPSKKKASRKSFVLPENYPSESPMLPLMNNVDLKGMVVENRKNTDDPHENIENEEIQVPLVGEELKDGDASPDKIKELFFHWTKTQSLLVKMHPDIALVDCNISSFNENVIAYFRNILKNTPANKVNQAKRPRAKKGNKAVKETHSEDLLDEDNNHPPPLKEESFTAQ